MFDIRHISMKGDFMPGIKYSFNAQLFCQYKDICNIHIWNAKKQSGNSEEETIILAIHSEKVFWNACSTIWANLLLVIKDDPDDDACHHHDKESQGTQGPPLWSAKRILGFSGAQLSPSNQYNQDGHGKRQVYLARKW